MIAATNFVSQVHNGTVSTVTSSQATLSNQSVVGGGGIKGEPSHSTAATISTTQNILVTDIKIEDSSHMEQTYGEEKASHPTESSESEVDITISNVVTSFTVRCHLNLRVIASVGSNVVYRREQSLILMKIRHPTVTASIFSSGKVTLTGATTEEEAKRAARKVARCLQRYGFRVKFGGFRVVNVLGSCRLPFGIKIADFATKHRQDCSYEPELHPGATFRVKDLKAVMKIFQTGAITITAPSVTNVQMAVEHIFPLVYDYRKPVPGLPKTVQTMFNPHSTGVEKDKEVDALDNEDNEDLDDEGKLLIDEGDSDND